MPKKNSKVNTFVKRDTLLGDMVKEHPYLSDILIRDYGLHCVGCFANMFDTVEGGAMVHGMSDSEIDGMIEHINLEISNKEKHYKYEGGI